ncbi:hypothetical protein KCV02_g18351, partial [Aureobasidium melanogenum]
MQDSSVSSEQLAAYAHVGVTYAAWALCFFLTVIASRPLAYRASSLVSSSVPFGRSKSEDDGVESANAISPSLVTISIIIVMVIIVIIVPTIIIVMIGSLIMMSIIMVNSNSNNSNNNNSIIIITIRNT